jgi:hypothetical protein
MEINLTRTLFFFILFLSIESFGNVIYVDADNISGNNDGTSWQDSYSNFQNAISEAIYGDTIWVAQGTYFPTTDINQDISFELRNGVKWFGGFQGNETALGQRDYELYSSVLSGDIGVQGDSLDNSHHVVYTISSDTTTILDGFLIRDGRAIDPVTPTGSPRNFGGGLLIDAMENDSIAEPKILNCTFQNNLALYGGGISFGKGYTNFHINPDISNCYFYQNEAAKSGGALSLVGGSNIIEEFKIIEDCFFENNKASNHGGGVYLSELTNGYEFLRCDFIENSSFEVNSFGGAISYYVEYYNNLIHLRFLNCNFHNNFSYAGGAINIFAPNFSTEETLELEIENSLFSNNFLTDVGVTGTAINYETNIRNQIFNIKNSKFITHDSNLGNVVIKIGTAPVFIDPANDNLNFSLIGCEFINNKSAYLRLRISNKLLNSKFIVSNTIFKDNDGLIILDKSNLPILDAQILNCTFLNNNSGIDKVYVDSTFVINIANSIFWEDLPLTDLFDDGAFFNSNLTGFNIHHSLLKSPDCLINGIDYCGDNMLYNLYPEFRDTMNNDLSLRSCSPAINQGENISIDTLGIFFDLEGNPRILDDAVDLGAYETQAFEVLVPQAQNVKCNGGADGGITWVQHGTPPFTFEWDNGVTTGTEFTGLSVGNYSIAVMDADSCTDTFSITVNQPLPLEIMDTVTAATGSMNADGMIEVMPSGGFPDYQYLWSNGDTTALIENLLSGTYTVTVTDANGCVEILEMEVGFMTVINQVDKKFAVQLIPNLIEQGMIAHLVFDLGENINFELEIFNELGQLLFFRKIKMGQGRSKYELPTLNERGLFFVKIKVEAGTQKLLKWIIH